MKTLRLLAALSTASLLALPLFSDIETPRVSLKSTISQTVGFSEVTIVYSRPNDKGREAIGGLAPFGKVWRTGANEATTIEFDSNVIIDGHKVDQGRYGLFTIPTKDSWTIILNSVADQWGAFTYDASKDVLRFEVPARKSHDSVESFTIQFANANYNHADIELRWEDTVVSFPIEVSAKEIDARTQASIRRDILDEHNATWMTYADAARYYVEKNKDLRTALSWFEESNELNPDAYWLFADRARLLVKLGEKEEALEVAKTAMKNGERMGDTGFVKGMEEMIASLK